ncbi:hypothetical protein GOB57_21500 [Sinorhizobium meliloti]|nr:hypothetical protein [Sinorhizobium meliloti]
MVVTGSYRARWVQRGETTHVHGMGLFTGLFYVGRTFGDGEGHDKYIVNPSLPIGRSSRDYIPGHDPWGASYEALPPSGRRAYLEWLSSSCRDTGIPVQFVRLFASGLFRRVFIDVGSDLDMVLAEARRLLALHADNPVMKELMSALIVFATGIGYRKGQVPVYRSEWRQSIHMAAEVKLRIAGLIGDRAPVGVDDAFLFALERSKVRPKGVVDVEGIRLLWKRVYSGSYPEGIVVDPPAQKIRLGLAMPDGVKSIKLPYPDWCKRLPEPSEASAFCVRIDSMFDQCVAELASYSKLVRKTPGAAGSLEAINVLPKQLVATSMAGRFASVKATLDSALAKQGVVASKVLKLFEFMELPFREDAEMSAGVRKLIAGAMDKMDIAFEPDGRFGAMGFTTKGSVVFFRGENGLPVEWEGAYAIHRACADFVIGHVCRRDEQALAAERALFEMRRADGDLNDRERTRLAAHSRSLVVDFGVRKGAPFRQSRLHESELLRLAHAVSEVVASLPELEVGSIATAEKFIEKLGGDRRALHAALHRRQPGDDDGLVSVVRAEPSRGVAIPSRPSNRGAPKPSPPTIDLDRLKRIEAETVMVTGLLSDIFAGDEVGEPSAAEKGCGGFSGLDAAHSEILEAVMASGEMTRAEFDTLAKNKRLLPDGVLETINDMAFDVLGQSVLIDNGNVIFEEHLRAELEQTRVTV